MLRLSLVVAAVSAGPVFAQAPKYETKENVIYGRKYGLALTLDAFIPKASANGAGVLFAVSGGWFSAKEATPPVEGFFKPFLDRGYAVFAVVHGSQPKFTVPEVLDDMHRAVRFVKAHAAEYRLDPDRLGMFGASAGGHLSLMQAVSPKAKELKPKDDVERQPSRVKAVAAFFPPTDFFNWGADGVHADPGRGKLSAFKAPFDFADLDPRTRAFEPVNDPDKRKEVFKRISPIYHVTKETPPVLLIHGDKDELVPLQQSERMLTKLKEAGVPCELVVRKGAAHGWLLGMDKDLNRIADWFDTHLKK